MNIVIEKANGRVVGVNRQPFNASETVIEGINPLDIPSKTIEYMLAEDKVDADGNSLYLLPQPDIEVIDTITTTIEITEVTDRPIIIKKTRQVPLLDADGKQVEYFPEYTRIEREEVIDEETEEVTIIEHEIVETSETPILCWTTEEYVEPKTDSDGNPLYLKDIDEEVVTFESQSPLEITAEHEDWNEDLEKIRVEVNKTKVVTIQSDPTEFTYSDIKPILDEKNAAKENEQMQLKENVNTLETRTQGMQEIDEFTLDKTFKLDDRTTGLQDIDEFTLTTLMQLQMRIEELESKLDGGSGE
ncbi:hypothetical protein ACJ2A9_04825 [Anaerobacillus sp. MEB173]|uniref:hypothetical protein n=1 Tax=Anaerobacillus sp. MEB173 TaxID=3383345 RepID=UPI003F93DCA3